MNLRDVFISSEIDADCIERAIAQMGMRLDPTTYSDLRRIADRLRRGYYHREFTNAKDLTKQATQTPPRTPPATSL